MTKTERKVQYPNPHRHKLCKRCGTYHALDSKVGQKHAEFLIGNSKRRGIGD